MMKSGRLLLALWLIANTLSFGFVGAMFHNFPVAFTFPPNISQFGRFSLAPASVGFLFGFIPSLLIGFLQYQILRRRWPLSRWWLVSVSLGIGIQHFLADGFENARDLSLAVLVSGLLVGVLQWRLLRPQFAASVQWLFISTFGWFVGWLIGVAVLHYTGLLYRPWVSGLDGQTHGILGLAVGATFSLSTGLMWVGSIIPRKDFGSAQ